MKVLFDYCLDSRDVFDFELVLNYSLDNLSDTMKEFEGRIKKLLKQFEDSEWLFNCLPDDLYDLDEASLNFVFDKDELNVLSLCIDRYVSLDEIICLRLKNRLLTVLLWSFFN